MAGSIEMILLFVIVHHVVEWKRKVTETTPSYFLLFSLLTNNSQEKTLHAATEG
jgi:hypothetical protein